MLRLARAAIVLIVSLLVAAPVWAAERFALVIGNQGYNDKVGPLRNPHNDIAVVGKALTEVGFKLLAPRQNATRDDILFAVHELAAQVRTVGRDAVSFLYYAGHGVGVGSDNVLVPTNAEDTSDAMLRVRGVRLGEILDILRQEAPDAVHFVVLDACRNNLRGQRGTRGFVPVNDRRTGVVIAFSTAQGETATDDGAKSTPYASALAEEIVKPGRNDQQVFNDVRTRVVKATGGQTPWTHDGLIGDRVVFKAATPAEAPPNQPALTPQQSSEAERAWDRTKDATSIPALEAFIRRFGDTYYGDLAKMRLVELRQIEAARQAVEEKKKADEDARVKAEAERQRLAQLQQEEDRKRAQAEAVKKAAEDARGRAEAERQRLAMLQREQAQKSAASGEVVRFGVAGPITGGAAAFGAQLKNGVEQAVADINAANGILGRQIIVHVGDDRANPRDGVSVANVFVANRVQFIVGHFHSGITIPASVVYADNDMLAITPSATDPCITDRKVGPCRSDGFARTNLLMFRTGGRDDQQGTVAGAYIAANFTGKRVVIVHDKTSYGLGLATETRKAMNAKGMKEIMFEGVNRDDKDFGAFVSKTKAAGTDLIYWGGLYDAGGLLLRQMRDQGVKARFMGGDGIAADEFPLIAGPGAEGALMTYWPDARKRPEARAVVARFRGKGFEPESYTLYAYAAVQVIKQAAEAENSVEPKRVAQRIYSGMKFNTVIGDLTYDAKGDVRRLNYVMYIWKRDATGKITYFEP